MSIAELFTDLPDDLWQRLKDQTKAALQTSDPTDYAYFKFVYLDNVTAPSSALTEYHLTVDWEDSGRDVQHRLREALAGVSASAPINIRFAGRSLEDSQTLAEIGAVYGDKIYFNVGDPKGGGPGPQGLAHWSSYFRRMSANIRRTPERYEELVDLVCQSLERTADLQAWTDGDWKLVLLTRHLPGVYAATAASRSVLKATRRLISLLEVALAQGNAAAIYQAANMLEWLAYLKPRMFEGVDLYEGDQARQALARNLLQALDPARQLPGRVRMEAAWAISWASVASQDFGREVYEHLVAFEQREPPTPIALTLRSAVLRSFLHPTPYLIAAISQAGGWFQASVIDEHGFRQLANARNLDTAVAHFRQALKGVLPEIEE